MTAEEVAWIETEPAVDTGRSSIRAVLRHKQTWAYMSGRFLIDPVWWTFLFWLPDFFSKQFGTNLAGFGPPLVAIYLMSDVGAIAGGWTSSHLLGRGWATGPARKLAMLLCAIFVVPVTFSAQAPSIWLAVILIGHGHRWPSGLLDQSLRHARRSFPRYAQGAVVGLGGFAGAAGGMLMSKYAGMVLESIGTYTPIFIVSGFAYLTALVVTHSSIRAMNRCEWNSDHDQAPAASPRPSLSRRAAHTRHRARSTTAVKGLPIISPHGHTDPAWFALNEPFPDPGATADRAGPLCVPHALQPGRPAGRSWRSHPRRQRRSRPIRSRSGGVSRPLPSVPRHAVAPVARLGLLGDLRPRRPAEPLTPPGIISTRSMPRCAPMRSGPAPCSNASTSRRSRPPKARPTSCHYHKIDPGRAAGAGASSPPIGPIR